MELKDDPGVIVWYHGKPDSSAKDVSVHKILGSLDSEAIADIDWSNLIANLQNNKHPVISWNDNYYELLGSSELSSFTLKNITSGEQYWENFLSSREFGEQRLLLAVNEEILSFNQSLVSKEIKLNIKRLSHVVVTTNGFKRTFNSTYTSLTFVSSLDHDELYTLTPTIMLIPGTTTNVVQLAVTDATGVIFQNRVNVGRSAEILLSNGDVIIVDVIAVNGSEISLRVRK